MKWVQSPRFQPTGVDIHKLNTCHRKQAFLQEIVRGGYTLVLKSEE